LHPALCKAPPFFFLFLDVTIVFRTLPLLKTQYYSIFNFLLHGSSLNPHHLFWRGVYVVFGFLVMAPRFCFGLLFFFFSDPDVEDALLYFLKGFFSPPFPPRLTPSAVKIWYVPSPPEMFLSGFLLSLPPESSAFLAYHSADRSLALLVLSYLCCSGPFFGCFMSPRTVVVQAQPSPF